MPTDSLPFDTSAPGLAALRREAADGASRDFGGPAWKALPRILISGSLIWPLEDVIPAIHAVLLGFSEGCGNRLIEVVHGAAPGADTAADLVAAGMGYSITRCPILPRDRGMGDKMAPLIRDRRMVETTRPDMIVGFPHPHSKTRGTWQTMAMGNDNGIPTYAVTSTPRPGGGYAWFWTPYAWGTDDVR